MGSVAAVSARPHSLFARLRPAHGYSSDVKGSPTPQGGKQQHQHQHQHQQQHQPPPPETPSPKGLAEQLKAFFKQYGRLGLGIYLSVTAVSFGSIYLSLKSGVDVKGLMRRLGLPESAILDGAGTVAVAYAIHKLLMPLRLFLTVALTTWVARRAPRWTAWINTLGRGSGEHKR